jgi:glutamate decarboxylase
MALHTKVDGDGLDGRYLSVNRLLDGEKVTVPRHRLPDGPMLPEMAYEIVHDELMLDGNAHLNLATFVTTWMEPQAEKLMAEALDKNMIDKDEYPQTADVQICWEKFCNYFEVEPRYVPMEGNRFHLNGEEAVKLCDENTIGVVAVLGSTFDGSCSPEEAHLASAYDEQASAGATNEGTA